MADLIVVDFAGTLIKNEIIQEANTTRSRLLDHAQPTAEEHAHEEKLYKRNRASVQELTGLQEDDHLLYRTATHEDTTISGAQAQNMISTTLFQIGMYAAAKKHGRAIATDGLLEELQRLKEAGYELAIASGVRTDIITGMLAIAEIDLFDHVIGQPPTLGVSNDAQLRELASRGKLAYVIGDKTTDLEPAKKHGATAVWATWGTPRGGEEEVADHTIENPRELRDVITTPS